MARTAVLVDERDQKLGTCIVPENAFVIQHADRIFIRQGQGVRLSGGGIGAVFIEQEPLLRERLGRL